MIMHKFVLDHVIVDTYISYYCKFSLSVSLSLSLSLSHTHTHTHTRAHTHTGDIGPVSQELGSQTEKFNLQISSLLSSNEPDGELAQVRRWRHTLHTGTIRIQKIQNNHVHIYRALLHDRKEKRDRKRKYIIN